MTFWKEQMNCCLEMNIHGRTFGCLHLVEVQQYSDKHHNHRVDDCHGVINVPLSEMNRGKAIVNWLVGYA